MSADAHAPSPVLARLHTQAQAEAQRLFGDGPVAAWDAPARPHGRPRAWRTSTLAIGVAATLPAGTTPGPAQEDDHG